MALKPVPTPEELARVARVNAARMAGNLAAERLRASSPKELARLRALEARMRGALNAFEGGVGSEDALLEAIVALESFARPA